jgi:tRNA (adenine57-N1/adenine58-N1)-methyltransferase
LEEAGYAEGNVTNTRFGSFPHSTLLGLPWGSQVRASKVDTGTRGRKAPQISKKRKSDAISGDVDESNLVSPDVLKEAVADSSGFLHVLPPTPENWTTSLPHRTQVVYTPDYSYILHRIRARPGTVLIEAGSGSGSFTHAAARAVFNGYTAVKPLEQQLDPPKAKLGKIFTYEFHAERQSKVAQEMIEHGLEEIS